MPRPRRRTRERLAWTDSHVSALALAYDFFRVFADPAERRAAWRALKWEALEESKRRHPDEPIPPRWRADPCGWPAETDAEYEARLRSVGLTVEVAT